MGALVRICRAMALMAALGAPGAMAQAPTAAGIVSPQVLPDHRVTFRLLAPEAKRVMLEGDFWPERDRKEPMTRGADGVWTFTTAPLAPDYYSYAFALDGVPMPDPANGQIKPGARVTQSAFLLPGEEAAYATLQDVPHGEVRQVWYRSPVTGTTRRLHIYLPPGYDGGRQRYPVTYLFHGGGDDDGAWTSIGRANLILDNLIARGQALPMIVVMPDLWAADTAHAADNNDLFRRDLTQVIIPYIDTHLRTILDAKHRAVGGLGIGRPMMPDVVWPVLDRFGTVFFASGGGGAGHYARLERQYPGTLERPQIRQGLSVFLGDGASDGSLVDSRFLENVLKQHGIRVTARQSMGGHGWPAFRHAFAAFAQTVFQH